MGNINTRLRALLADDPRKQIVTDRRHELYVRAEPRQIVADVARHAAGRDLDLAGVGIARLDRRIGPAAEIDVRAADADGMKQVMDEINQLEKTTIEQPKYIEFREYGPTLALLALALLMLGFIAECTWNLRLP